MSEYQAKKIDAEVKSITVTLARPEEKKGHMPVGLEGLTGFWKEALQEALDRMAVFKDDSKNKVSIQVKILALNPPTVGLAMTTKSIARYEIIDRATGSIIHTQEITSTAVVPMNYAFMGAVRAHESVNRSVQDNIKQFLQALETIDISVTAPKQTRSALCSIVTDSLIKPAIEQNNTNQQDIKYPPAMEPC